MSNTEAHPSTSAFPAILKEWRQTRSISQLELAMRAGSSQRHISFLESGRSNPSRVMVFALSEAMDIPLRNRNELMLAAGFAPTYRERALDDPALLSVKSAVDRIITTHDPYPAIVFDWRHDVLAANAGAMRLQMFLFDVADPDNLPSIASNVLRGLLHPDGYRNYIANWDHVAATMLRRLRAEVLAAGSPRDGIKLLDELSGYDGVPTTWRQCPDLDWQEPMLAIEIAKNGQTIGLFSTLTSLGAPFEVTLQETRIESFFPMDAESGKFFQ